MALPRSKYVREDTVGIYHCFCRCVRRAYLCGFDKTTGRDFTHRKVWIKERLRLLSSLFALEVFSYSVVENHYHVILRTRPDIAATWSEREVARRWLTLCPKRYRSKKKPPPTMEEQIEILADNGERIEELRKRLSSLSWFMKQMNEYIARAANREDGVKGRFWESRFKCQGLLDEAALVACMVYVDLNPIRAGLAATPEESDFTGIQDRILRWRKGGLDEDAGSDNWLCPITTGSKNGGILQMTMEEYFELVDASGRMIRPDKRGAIEVDLAPILKRIGARQGVWADTIMEFGDRFGLVVGHLSNMRDLAVQLGKRWFVGIAAARTAFIV